MTQGRQDMEKHDFPHMIHSTLGGALAGQKFTMKWLKHSACKFNIAFNTLYASYQHNVSVERKFVQDSLLYSTRLQYESWEESVWTLHHQAPRVLSRDTDTKYRSKTSQPKIHKQKIYTSFKLCQSTGKIRGQFE